MALRLINGPEEEILDYGTVTDHLRVDSTADAAYIDGLVTAVRQRIERTELSSALITQTWELVLDCVPGPEIRLPRPPLQSVTSITFIDQANAETVVNSSNYLVDADSWPGRIVLKSTGSWPSVTLRDIGGVVIRYIAGYGDTATDVPAPIRQAALLMIGDLYENREDTVMMPGQGQTITLPLAARRLLDDYRVRRF
jgi:uncharacterized phiE125 gp8 family phage protein